MEAKFEIAIIFRKKTTPEEGTTFYPHHIVVGHKDEKTGEFVTRAGKRYSYLLDKSQKYGYGLREPIIFKEVSKKDLPIIKKTLKEYAKSYFEFLKNNTYQFKLPNIGNYEEVEFVVKNKATNEDLKVPEKDLELAKKILREQERFDAKELSNFLKSNIIGQDKAIEEIVSILWQNTRSDIKNNILLIGPSGVGKTEIIRNISKKLNIPTIIVDTTTLTATGYQGNNVEDIIFDLINRANGDLSKASRGIIFLDEIDKKYTNGSRDREAEIGSSAVQDELLKLLEDGEYTINLGSDMFPDYKIFPTKNITVIASGAFTELLEKRSTKEKQIGFETKIQEEKTLPPISVDDLYQYGLKKELVGRLPNIIELKPLSEKDLIQILKSQNSKILQSKIAILKELGIHLNIKEETFKTIAEEAKKKNTGARGLISSVEKVFAEPMTEISMNPEEYQELIIEPKTNKNPKGYCLIKKK